MTLEAWNLFTCSFGLTKQPSDIPDNDDEIFRELIDEEL